MNDQADTYNPSTRPPGSREDSPLARIDVRERGADRNGQPQVMDRRLFMQLLVWSAPLGHDAEEYARELAERAQSARVAGVLYDDVNDPRSFALLTWSEDPNSFVSQVRPLLGRAKLRDLQLRPEMTMLGRTYSQGYEQDLEYWIIRRPQETVLNAEFPWAVWYPLRRTGAFERLDSKEQSSILREHAVIGRTYGAKDLAHDIRLACHGLDAADNEFVIGLVGRNLHPLSHVVQTMRKTRQTSQYIQHMGPFFVGHARWRSGGAAGGGVEPSERG